VGPVAAARRGWAPPPGDEPDLLGCAACGARIAFLDPSATGNCLVELAQLADDAH
jgi:hypothetical protein